MADQQTDAEDRDQAQERYLRSQVPRFSRRTLIKGAVGVAVVGAVPVGLYSALHEGPTEGLGPDRPLFERLTQVVLPVHEGSPFASPSELPVVDHVDAMLRRLDPELRSDLGTGFRLFDYGAILIGLNFKRFVSLGDEAALDYCHRWEKGNTVQRGLMNAMKSMILVSYWREDATWPAVGYAGPVSAKNGTPRLGNAPLPPEDRPPAPEGAAEGGPDAADEGAEGAETPAGATEDHAPTGALRHDEVNHAG